jgi:hypothetical protein
MAKTNEKTMVEELGEILIFSANGSVNVEESEVAWCDYCDAALSDKLVSLQEKVKAEAEENKSRFAALLDMYQATGEKWDTMIAGAIISAFAELEKQKQNARPPTVPVLTTFVVSMLQIAGKISLSEIGEASHQVEQWIAKARTRGILAYGKGRGGVTMLPKAAE